MQIKMSHLLRHRNIWLGCAMVWIVLAHSGFQLSSTLFQYIKTWGYGGVDLCLFASGIGCYFSLEKDPDVLRFMKRRIFRLAPAYWCVVPVWIIYKTLTSEYPAQAALGVFLGIQTFTGLGNSFNWYISALLLIYILAPYLKALVDRIVSIRKQILVLASLIIISIPFWHANSYIITITRIPIFYIGLLFAKYAKEDKLISSKDILSYCLLTLAGFAFLYGAYYFCTEEALWSYGLHWYPFILISPGICVLISLFAEFLTRFTPGIWINNLLEEIGNYSFELYLIHVPLYETLNSLFDIYSPACENLLWLCTIPLLTICCILLKITAKSFQHFLEKTFIP